MPLDSPRCHDPRGPLHRHGRPLPSRRRPLQSRRRRISHRRRPTGQTLVSPGPRSI
jgi:hypothetical protein